MTQQDCVVREVRVNLMNHFFLLTIYVPAFNIIENLRIIICRPGYLRKIFKKQMYFKAGVQYGLHQDQAC